MPMVMTMLRSVTRTHPPNSGDTDAFVTRHLYEGKSDTCCRLGDGSPSKGYGLGGKVTLLPPNVTVSEVFPLDRAPPAPSRGLNPAEVRHAA